MLKEKQKQKKHKDKNVAWEMLDKAEDCEENDKESHGTQPSTSLPENPKGQNEDEHTFPKMQAPKSRKRRKDTGMPGLVESLPSVHIVKARGNGRLSYLDEEKSSTTISTVEGSPKAEPAGSPHLDGIDTCTLPPISSERVFIKREETKPGSSASATTGTEEMSYDEPRRKSRQYCEPSGIGLTLGKGRNPPHDAAPQWFSAYEEHEAVDDAWVQALYRHFETFLKLLLVSVLLLLVFAGTAFHQATLVLTINQMKESHCLEVPGGASAQCQSQMSRWMWTLLLLITIPEMLILLRCAFYWCTSGSHKKASTISATRRSLKILTFEVAHAFGVGLLVFVVFPLLESAVYMVAILPCTALVPAIMSLIHAAKNKERACSPAGKVMDGVATLVQVSGLVTWPILVGLRSLPFSSHLIWSLPLSLIMISASYALTSSYRNDNRDGQSVRENFHDRNVAYMLTSFIKLLFYFIFMIVVASVKGIFIFEHGLTQSPSYVWGWVLLLNVMSGVLCYLSARTATKICAEVIGYALPLMLAPVLVYGFLAGSCEALRYDPNFFSFLPADLTFTCPVDMHWSSSYSSEYSWLFCVWWLSEVWIARHLVISKSVKLAKSDSTFFAPLYDGVVLQTSLMFNRVIHPQEETDEPTSVPIVKICATMWHEDSEEMSLFLKSLCRLDMDQAKRAYCQKRYGVKDPDFYNFEGHIFFDDAIERFNPKLKVEMGLNESKFDKEGKRVNNFVCTLVKAVKEASVNYPDGTPIADPVKYATPYGGRLVWTLPGQNKLIVHLKDKAKVKHKKRWSQVMYMYYFLDYELENAGGGDVNKLQQLANNTFLLALDGDVDFQPIAVRLLLDRMRRDVVVGAACGRIHPTGAGPMVWYQKFEYALGHWLQKATEHVLGSVLCSPGCFSLFRGSALMSKNVMKTYTHESVEAHHHVQYDQGEDRWLCTLLLQQGWHVEYCAASDAFTKAPTGFEEFYKQRRRWMPSTMANILDLLLSWRSTIQKNQYVTLIYIAYQALMFVMSLLGTGNIFLMIVNALSSAFGDSISPNAWFVINLALLGAFVAVCLLGSENKQIALAMVLSTVYAVVQGVVLVAIFVGMDGTCSDTFIFFVLVAASFFLSAILHPKEMLCIIHGLLYFFLVPSMYMLLMIYALTNLNNVSWGVRESAQTTYDKALEKSTKKKAEMELEKSVVEATGIKSFFGFGDEGKGNETGWTVKVGGCCRYTCCPRGNDSDMEVVLAQQSRMDSKIEQLMNLIQKDTKQLSPIQTRQDRNEDGVNDSSKTHEPLRPAHVDKSDRTAGSVESLRDSWLEDSRYLPLGPVLSLDQKEQTFFEELTERFLKPKEETEAQKNELKKELKDLRNKVTFFYLLFNVLFVVIVYTLKVYEVQIPWVCLGTTIDPISMVFVAFFGSILIIQTLGMMIHRIGTVIQIVANTQLMGKEERLGRKAIEELFSLVDSTKSTVARRSRVNSRGGSGKQSVLQGGRRQTIFENQQARQRREEAQQRADQMLAEGGGKDLLTTIFDQRIQQGVDTMDARQHRRSVIAHRIHPMSNSSEGVTNGALETCAEETGVSPV